MKNIYQSTSKYLMPGLIFSICLCTQVLFGQLNMDDPLGQERNVILENELLIWWSDQFPVDDIYQAKNNLYNLNNSSITDLDGGFPPTIEGFVEYYTDTSATDLPFPMEGGVRGIGGSDMASGNLYQDPTGNMLAFQSSVMVWAGADHDGFIIPQVAIRSPQFFDVCESAGYYLGMGPPAASSVLYDPVMMQEIGTVTYDENPSLQVVVGNFMCDSAQSPYNGEDEIVMAYTDNIGKIFLYIFEPGKFCYSSLGDSSFTVPFPIRIDSIEGPSYNRTGARCRVMDLGVGDIDLDGYDEIIMPVIYPNEKVYTHIYQFNESTQSLEEKYRECVWDPNELPCFAEGCSNPANTDAFQVQVAPGNYFAEFPGDEIVVGIYNQNSSNASDNRLSLIPLRENSTQDGLIVELCSPCNPDCATGNCSTSDYLFYELGGIGGASSFDRFDMESGDLDGTLNPALLGDELVLAFNDQVRVLNFSLVGGRMKINSVNTFNVTNYNHDLNDNLSGKFAQDFLKIGNVNEITSSVNANRLANDIVVMTNDVQFDPSDQSLTRQEFLIEVFGYEGLTGQIDLTTDPTLMMSRRDHVDLGEYQDIRQYSLELFDADGGGILLGKPERRQTQTHITPMVVMNSPPGHFDIFDNDTFDLNNLYDAGDLPAPANSNFSSRTVFTEETSSDTILTAEINSDWALSMNLAAGYGGYGVKVEGKIGRTFGEKFSNVASSTRQLTFVNSYTNVSTDRMLAYETNYDVYEYPVYFNSGIIDTLTHVIVLVPHYSATENYINQEDFTHDYQLNHQQGNILSYAHDQDDLNNIDPTMSFDLGGVDCDNQPYDLFKSLKFSQATGSAISEENNLQHTFEAEAGFAYGGASVSASVAGEYNSSNLSTRSTTLSNTKEFEIFFKSGEAPTTFKYEVRPFLYWDISGAIVADYTIQVDTTPNDLWESYYNGPDPAFLLPNIHDPEKGEPLPSEARRWRSKEVTVFPLPVPGREVTLFARVHNLGLQKVNAGLPVCFYYNTEDDEEMQLIGCDTIQNNLASRSTSYARETVSIDWMIPNTVTSAEKPKIISIIDPGNINQNEIHDYPIADGITNNIAWNCLYGANCGDIDTMSYLFPDPCLSVQAILNISDDPILSGTYQATHKIIVNGRVPAGNQVIFRAPNAIEVLPSFQAELGSDVEMQIGDCEN